MSNDLTPTSNNEGKVAKQQVVAYTQKSQIKHENRHIQLVREYGFHPRTKATVGDGDVLPKKFEPFPENMYGKPLEEIDAFIYEETFCVVSKRFRKNYIHRFTGTKSLFLFHPWSIPRSFCVYIATNQYFDYCVMATILFNCIFLAMTETFEEAEYIFLAIYTVEMIIKIIAKGFLLNKYTYLRNPWNWLDFVVIASGYATIAMDVGNLAGLRTFRVLRALKTVSIMPGLKTIINALLHSFRQLAEVMTLTIFCLMVFALFALQVYMGELRNKCVKTIPDEWINTTDLEWRMWINDTDNWLYDDEELPMLCGNITGARHCPDGFICLCVGENPNHGYTNFDNFMWSMLTTFQLITLDYWENVYNMVLATSGPMSVSFFTVVVFFGSFYLINLMLAVVALSYEEEAEITNEERKKDLLDHRDDSTFSFDPSVLNVKKLTKNNKKKFDSRKGVLLASYSKKKTRRKKLKCIGSGGGSGLGDNNHQESNGNNGRASNGHSLVSTPSRSPRHSSGYERPKDLPIKLKKKQKQKLQQQQQQKQQQQQQQQQHHGKQQLEQLHEHDYHDIKHEQHNDDDNDDDDAVDALNPEDANKQQQQQQQQQQHQNQQNNDNNNMDKNPNMLYPSNHRGQLRIINRQGSSTSSGGIGGIGGAVNRESSQDDSGVVDDHDDNDDDDDNNDDGNDKDHNHNHDHDHDHDHGNGDNNEMSKNNMTVELQSDLTPVTLALSPREVRLIKCNGNIARIKKHNIYALHPEYTTEVVVIDDLPDRNCDGCIQCCIDYEGWLQFQNCLYKVVRDPLFELAITLCIVLNTAFLAMEHHGMSENFRNALDVGNKVFTSIFTFECVIKLMALSKDFFLCGWNIFDLIIVTASLLDIIFELVDGLSVLRGLRLLRVLKLAQSWTTMKVLLSIIISTIGALGNLTLILVIVIYIFAVIGMQLFSKDYTPDKFEPDPVPRWNFNDFFHSFMMIFRILCGEWIEPLWDCMRAEEEEGASSCFAIFLPTLVMGNFMVLNLFLALLLNSFNSEELKSKKEEVGEESKLTRSIERVRDLIRKKRLEHKERKERKYAEKFQQIVIEAQQQAAAAAAMASAGTTNIGIGIGIGIGTGSGTGAGAGAGAGTTTALTTGAATSTMAYERDNKFHRLSYQESMNRPVCGTDFGYQIPLKGSLHTIIDGIEGTDDILGDDKQKRNGTRLAVTTTETTVTRKGMEMGMGMAGIYEYPNKYRQQPALQLLYQQQQQNEQYHQQSIMMPASFDGTISSSCQLDNNSLNLQAEQQQHLKRLPRQMSSGFGSTQPNNSHDESILYTESIELRLMAQFNNTSTDTDPYNMERGGGCHGIDIHNDHVIRADSLPERPYIEEHDEAYLKYQKNLLTRSPSYRKSLDRLSQSSDQSQRSLIPSNSFRSDDDNDNDRDNDDLIIRRSERSGQSSLNTMSLEHDDLLSNQANLRDELLNCDQKELFQFLQNDDADDQLDHSNTYYTTLGEADTDSLLVAETSGGGGGGGLKSDERKPSSSSIKSNLSYISNSILHTLEARRNGGSHIQTSVTTSVTVPTGDIPSTATTTATATVTATSSNHKYHHLNQYYNKHNCHYSSRYGGHDHDYNHDNDHNNDNDSLPLVDHSEFDNIIQSFEKELEEIKKSTTSLERHLSTLSEPSPAADEANKAILEHIAVITGATDRTAADEVVHTINPFDSYDLSTVPRRQHTMPILTVNNQRSKATSVKLKRRSLEKQRKIDEDFSISNEIRKICDQIHAPYVDGTLTVSATTASGSQSPFTRRKSDLLFSAQMDRFKRMSLIERVEELPEDEKPISTLRIESERLPRKCLKPDAAIINSTTSNQLDSLSLKSMKSYENIFMAKKHPESTIAPSASAFASAFASARSVPLKGAIESAALMQVSSLKSTPPLTALTEHQQHYHAQRVHRYSPVIQGMEPISKLKTAKSTEHPQLRLDKAASFQSARTESRSSGSTDITRPATHLARSGIKQASSRGSGQGDGEIITTGMGTVTCMGDVSRQFEQDQEHRQQQQQEQEQQQQQQQKSAFTRLTEKPWHCLVSYVDDLTVGGRRNSQGAYNDPMTFPSFGHNKSPKVPDDCFPQKCYDHFYFRCPCFMSCMDTKSAKQWTEIRTAVLTVVDTPAFEWFVLVLIFASSITLCFEDIYLDSNKSLKRILYWTNFTFCLIFVVEMILKWLALGFSKYFTSFWTILDFIIVFVSVFSLLIEENENLKVLRSLRTLRALRPLRAISRWQGMRIVVNALMYAIPSIFNVLLVCLVFWLIFSIMGVQFFGGKFFKCLDDDGELLPITEVNDKWDCIEQNYSWINSKITFDHVGMGYLALLQVATFEGWMEVMADAVDARGIDLQPQREANLYAYIYFVIFIVCGSFFTLNLFIGVIIDNFNMLKKKYEGGVLEMFLTESQKHYYTAMKKLGRKKPQKVIKRPINHFLAMFYDLSNSRRFEIAIFVLIFLNMLTMGIEHYNQPHAVFFILEVSNAFFTTVFGLEAIVKIIGLRYHYFTVPWNVFDFLLVLASIFGILMEDIMIDLPISPTLLRVVRVFRIGRILRLIKAAKGIRKLLFALVVSLPALFNIGALLGLITFIYAILGMSLFGHVKLQGALDDMVNFQTFGRSMQLLFRLMTSAGWNDVLESLMIQPPDCDPHFNKQTNGDCGHPLLAITYFTSFIIISYMIVINMYIAIILENFNQAHQEEEIGIVEDDLEMFYIRWSKYDPHAAQFIHFSQLSDFIASLDPPLGIPKPNTVALVSFNLPISRGNKIHCLDILHALVKHVLGHVEETDNFKQLQEQMDVKFKKQFPTRKELEIVSSTRIWKRQEKAAKLIQNAWREYQRKKKEKERSNSGDSLTQTSSPGGWHARLSSLNFFHLQVSRRGTQCSSRASSRKSSRGSNVSDISDLAGPWLNLPLMLVSGADDVVKDIKQQSDDLGKRGSIFVEAPRANRRRSFYNFFLRHQDAVDDCLTSPSMHRKSAAAAVIASTTSLAVNAPASENNIMDVKPIPQYQSQQHQQQLQQHQSQHQQQQQQKVIMTPTRKRATSFIKKKPPLERDDGSTPEVIVTKPSPEQPVNAAIGLRPDNSTLVHVLVHRESEEYKEETDAETKEMSEGEANVDFNADSEQNHSHILTDAMDDNIRDVPEIHTRSHNGATETANTQSRGQLALNEIEPYGSDIYDTIIPTVQIMVESPKEPPRGDFSKDYTASVTVKRSQTPSPPSSPPLPEPPPPPVPPGTPVPVLPPPLPPLTPPLTACTIEEPIDVNIQGDTSQVFYDYNPPDPHTNEIVILETLAEEKDDDINMPALPDLPASPELHILIRKPITVTTAITATTMTASSSTAATVVATTTSIMDSTITPSQDIIIRDSISAIATDATDIDALDECQQEQKRSR